MAVSPPPGNCEQAFQDAVAVGPFHTTSAPWRTCTQATPLLENTYLILCSSRKYTYALPTEGTFALDPPPSWNLDTQGVRVRPPCTPRNFRNFLTWLGTLWKEYLCQKCCCTILSCER